MLPRLISGGPVNRQNGVERSGGEGDAIITVPANDAQFVAFLSHINASLNLWMMVPGRQVQYRFQLRGMRRQSYIRVSSSSCFVVKVNPILIIVRDHN